jgi:hypothetical protein
MPTTHNIEVSSITAPSGDVHPRANGTIDLITNKEEADAFIAKIHARTFPIFVPPGTCPIRMGGITKMAATKTKLKAERRAAKEKKAKEAKKKKAAMAARKLDTQAKKREKLILLTEACAWKAAAKVESIRTQLAGVMAQGVMTLSTKISSPHIPKKSKGVSGQGTLSSPLSTSFAHLSPQRKVTSPKKRTMINSPLRSSGGLSSSSGSYSTMDSVESRQCTCHRGNIPGPSPCRYWPRGLGPDKGRPPVWDSGSRVQSTPGSRLPT